MTIKFIKLKNGDDIVSDVEQETADTLKLKVPARVSTIKKDGDDPKTAVDLYLPHVKGFSASVQKTDILIMEDANPALKEYYTEHILDMMPT